jgi:PAS domain-containing protein
MLRWNALKPMPTSEQHIQDKLGAIAQKLSAIEQRAESDTASKRTLGLLEDCRRLVDDLERAFTSLRDADRRHAAHHREAAIAGRRADLLLELSPMAYVLVHANGIIIDANASAARLLNLSLRHLRGKPFDLFLHGDRAAFLDRLKEVREDSGPERWRVTLRPRERCARPISVVAACEAEGRLALVLMPTEYAPAIDGAPAGGAMGDPSPAASATDPAATH